MKGQRLDIIYGIKTVSVLDAWSIILGYIISIGYPIDADAKIYEKKIKLNKIYDFLKKNGKTHFRITIGNLSVGYCAVTAWKHVLIDVESKECPSKLNWNGLIERFLDKETFIQAWISDMEYVFWQNAADPMEYMQHNVSYDNLPMKSNGLPPPLEKRVIDTSKNPARRIIRMGYVEAIGSVMWLGDSFWEITGRSKMDVVGAYIGKSEFIRDDVLKISLYHEHGLFTSSSDVFVQNNMRKIIYGM